VLMLDGDEAGLRASKRLLPICLQNELYAKEFVLPKGEDPDSWAQKTKVEEMEAALTNAPFHLDSVVERILNHHQGTIEQEVQGGREVMEILNQIKDPLHRELRVKHFSERLGISSDKLLGKHSRKQGAPSPLAKGPVQGQPQPAGQTTLEQEFLELIFAHPRRLGDAGVELALDWLHNEKIAHVCEELIKIWHDHGYSSGDDPIEEREIQFLGALKKQWEDAPKKIAWLAKSRLSHAEEFSGEDRKLKMCLKRLQDESLKRKSRESIYAMKQLNPSKQWDRIEELMQRHLQRARRRHGITGEDKVNL